MLFFPNQQELDCFNTNGNMLGKIKFNASTDKHEFQLDNDSITLSNDEEKCIAEKLVSLDLGAYSIPMQDDD